MIEGLDHVQVSIPEGGETEARDFFKNFLGLQELDKPRELAGRGGVWFVLPDGRQLHVGVQKPFAPNKKAHPAFLASSIGDLAGSLEAEGYTVAWDEALAPRPPLLQ